MTRERWQDNEKVKDALARVLCRICPECGHGVTWHGGNHDDGCTRSGCECGFNARECDAKINDEANVYALVEAVAACVDASPSEATGGEVVAEAYCTSWNRIMLHHTEPLTKMLAEGAVSVPLYSAPLAGDGVPRVTKVRAVKWKIGASPSDPLRFHEDIFIEERINIDGDVRYAVTQRGNCLRKDGHWEYEPQPSSRDDEFFARCRYATIEEALSYCATRQGEAGNG